MFRIVDRYPNGQNVASCFGKQKVWVSEKSKLFAFFGQCGF